MTDGMGTGRRVIALVAAAGVLMIAAVPAQGASQPRWMGLFRAINKVRANHGLHPIVISTRLHLAARRHSHDMLWRGYFAHTSPTGSTMTDRILRTGYVSGYNWIAGETLAWGWGTQAGPRATVRAWLHSPEHRAIVLSPRYKTVGIARSCGRFLGYSGACVWTADWVTRW